MSRTHTADGRRRASMGHAKRTHQCGLCGTVTRGNGGKSSHMLKHVREAGLDHLDTFEAAERAMRAELER